MSKKETRIKAIEARLNSLRKVRSEHFTKIELINKIIVDLERRLVDE